MLAVLFAGLLLSYPWEVLTAGSFLYLAAIPLAYLHYKKLERTHLVASGGVMPQPPAAEAEQTAGTAELTADTLSKGRLRRGRALR